MSKERDYERFLSMQQHVANQVVSISEFGHSMKVSDNINEACNLLGEALRKLEDVNDLIEVTWNTEQRKNHEKGNYLDCCE